jgi:hypothetical protein
MKSDLETHSVIPYDGKIMAPPKVSLSWIASDGRRPPAALHIMRIRRSLAGIIDSGWEVKMAW